VSHDGFTLIEVIVVMMIMGMIAALALTSLQSGTAESKLSGASGEITLALGYAQMVAMTSGSQARVTIDAEDDTILVERFEISGDIMGGATELPEADIESGSFVAVVHPAKRGENYYIVFAREDRLEGVDIVSATFGAGQIATFGAMGVPSNGGTVTLALGSTQVVLTVDPLSGVVTANN